jgi:hypothetical protein
MKFNFCGECLPQQREAVEAYCEEAVINLQSVIGRNDDMARGAKAHYEMSESVDDWISDGLVDPDSEKIQKSKNIDRAILGMAEESREQRLRAEGIITGIERSMALRPLCGRGLCSKLVSVTKRIEPQVKALELDVSESWRIAVEMIGEDPDEMTASPNKPSIEEATNFAVVLAEAFKHANPQDPNK